MSWNPFRLFTNDRNIIRPGYLSECLHNVAIIYATNGYPFNEWNYGNLHLSTEDAEFYKRICNVYQFRSIATVIENQFRNQELAELCLSAVFEKIFVNNDRAKAFLAFLYEEAENFQWLQIISRASEKKTGVKLTDAETLKILNQTSKYWCRLEFTHRKIETELTEEKIVQLANCISHASKNASDFFIKMFKNAELDLSNISPVAFRTDRSIYEEILHRKIEFFDIFGLEDKCVVTASDLLDAKKKEKESFGLIWDKQEKTIQENPHLMLKIINIIQNGGEFEDLYNHFRTHIFEIDDLRKEAYKIGGYAVRGVQRIEKMRTDTQEIFIDLSKQPDLPNAKIVYYCMRLFEIADEGFEKWKRLIHIMRSSEIAEEYRISYLITCDDGTLRLVKEHFSDSFVPLMIDQLRKISTEVYFKGEKKGEDEDLTIKKMKILLDKKKILEG